VSLNRSDLSSLTPSLSFIVTHPLEIIDDLDGDIVEVRLPTLHKLAHQISQLSQEVCHICPALDGVMSLHIFPLHARKDLGDEVLRGFQSLSSHSSLEDCLFLHRSVSQ
jgi:hypothetical protein